MISIKSTTRANCDRIDFKNHRKFAILFISFTLVLAASKFYWIYNALPSEATVLSIEKDQTVRPFQYYAVLSYNTEWSKVETRSTYNLPVSPGETVEILYNPDDITDFRLRNPYWLWYDVWSWYRLVLVVIALYYVVLFIYSKERSAYLGADNSNKKKPLATALKKHTARRKPVWVRILTVLLILMIPIGLYLAGEAWDLSYLRQTAIVVFLALAVMGPSSRSSAGAAGGDTADDF